MLASLNPKSLQRQSCSVPGVAALGLACISPQPAPTHDANQFKLVAWAAQGFLLWLLGRTGRSTAIAIEHIV